LLLNRNLFTVREYVRIHFTLPIIRTEIQTRKHRILVVEPKWTRLLVRSRHRIMDDTTTNRRN